VRILHTVLTAGAVLAVGALVALPLMRNLTPPLAIPMLGYGIAVASVAVMMAATVIMRPRVPARPRDQSTDAFWDQVSARGPALATWALCEAAAVIGAVGFFLTGVTWSLAGTSLALVALVWQRPSVLETAD
jgi:hypothetical protein